MLRSPCVITPQDDIFPGGKNTHELGNSDRIRLKFGNFGIEVLEHGSGIRVSNLYSVEAGKRTNRTLAIVACPAVMEPAFSDEHAAIMGGESIGIVFRNSGWEIEKRHHYFGDLDSPNVDSGDACLFGDTEWAHAAIHVYSLIVRKQDTGFLYASIAELHHPEYLTLDDLGAIYGNVLDPATGFNKSVGDMLKMVKDRVGGG
jgi:hypothetical protein